MHQLAGRSGFDVVLVTANSAAQAIWWQHRLEAGRGSLLAPHARVFAIHEEWNGGAGNGLGTLNALMVADARARRGGSPGLLRDLEAGARVGLYHAAGAGTRLAPLPACECADKSAVKLPALVDIAGRRVPMTILEAVVRQTAPYASTRPGRLSVFFADQVFVPSCPMAYTPRHHVDILASFIPLPDVDAWRAQRLSEYGLVGADARGNATQINKITHAELRYLVAQGALDVDGGIGVSMGSFSMSSALCRALVNLLRPELDARTGCLDSDPHFWMPLGLDEDTYALIMAGKGMAPAEAITHHRRMQQVASMVDGGLGLLGAVDVGAEAWWWDYGRLPLYMQHNLGLLADSAMARGMRRFFGVEDRKQGSRLGSVDVDERSIVLGCDIRRGRVRNSVLVGVTADHLEIEDAVLIEARVPHVACTGGLIYNVHTVESVSVLPGCTLCGIRDDESGMYCMLHEMRGPC
jgi:hypothetical protein